MNEIIKILASGGSSLSGINVNRIPKNTDFNIGAVLNWIYAATGLVAVAFIVFAAVKFAMAQGDPGKIKAASQTIVYAIIGLGVVLLAAAITYYVTGVL